MDYRQTLDFLFSSLPMYHRIGAAAYKEDLHNTIALCEILGNPQDKFSSVHIAGTNGKGSVSHLLASVLQESGFRTGLYTSPHLHDFRERIRINGRMIPEAEVVAFIGRYRNAFEGIGLSFFEMTVGMAFAYFAEQKVDIAVVETGLGGRLDSTNIITPVLSIITNIGKDHTRFLGNTIASIAAQKAGIIKEGVPAVISESTPATRKVFDAVAASRSAPLHYAHRHWNAFPCAKGSDKPGIQCIDIFHHGVPFLKEVALPLAGDYQLRNIPGLMQAIMLLKDKGYASGIDHIRRGLEQVRDITGLKGRWEILGMSPLIVADVAHNAAGLKAVIAQAGKIPFNRMHIVFGMVDDKDRRRILKLLPAKSAYYFCKPGIPRGLDAGVLQRAAERAGLFGTSYGSVKEAYMQAIANAGPDDLVLVCGSTFVISEIPGMAGF
jgi:dihydrofolate synthase/folylpolyglutamate synthase